MRYCASSLMNSAVDAMSATASCTGSCAPSFETTAYSMRRIWGGELANGRADGSAVSSIVQKRSIDLVYLLPRQANPQSSILVRAR